MNNGKTELEKLAEKQTIPAPGKKPSVREVFRQAAAAVAAWMGTPWAFATALLIVVVWAACGPMFAYSTTWQLVINTFTTIATFMMVFLIQNTQNRDARAIHLKLDELIRGTKGPRNLLVDLENCTDDEMDKFAAEFRRMRARHLKARKLAGIAQKRNGRALKQAKAKAELRGADKQAAGN